MRLRSTPTVLAATNMCRHTQALSAIYCRSFCRFYAYAPKNACAFADIIPVTYYPRLISAQTHMQNGGKTPFGMNFGASDAYDEVPPNITFFA